MIQAESLAPTPSFEDLLPRALPHHVHGSLKRSTGRLLGLDRLDYLYRCARSMEGERSFFDRVLGELGCEYRVSPGDLLRIPTSGPTIVVANHPFGAIEGMVLTELLSRVRPDVRTMANYLLGAIPELRDRLILVDPFGGEGAARSNIRPMKEAIEWLRGGGMLAMFPAGEVSSFRIGSGGITDPDWYPALARLVRTTGASVVPAFFPGSNGPLFQLLGLLHPRFRTAMLPRELLNKRDRTLDVLIGKPVPFRRLQQISSDEDMVAFLRMRTYALAHRVADAPPVRREPHEVDRQIYPSAIVSPVPAELVAREIASLPEEQLLISGGEMEVRYCTGEQAPQVLREIGRLREVTFRSVGEGTGGPIDLDEFDEHYLHLFVWNTARREVVGAYRLGRVDEILEKFGKKGLYTGTLFKFRKAFLRGLGRALEMGRAFIRPEYQRSYAPLLLLWRGIGEYIAQNPEYKTLFGPISISNEYRTMSRQLMVRFLEMNAAMPEMAGHVRPRVPFRIDLDPDVAATLAGTLDDLSWSISDIESDAKEVPVLLRQYLKLGARVLGFNVDDTFGNVVDGLILADLSTTDRKTLTRYMGPENAERFLAHHGIVSAEPVAAEG